MSAYGAGLISEAAYLERDSVHLSELDGLANSAVLDSAVDGQLRNALNGLLRRLALCADDRVDSTGDARDC